LTRHVEPKYSGFRQWSFDDSNRLTWSVLVVKRGRVTRGRAAYENLTLHPQEHAIELCGGVIELCGGVIELCKTAKGLVWTDFKRYRGAVKHMSYLSEMQSGESCSSATESWAEAPTQPQPARLNVNEINAATAPKVVPQGGVKDCCE
jgi:hypothetical protein